MTFELGFVDSVTDSPTTRLTLMGEGTAWRTLLEGTDFGMPSLRRAVAGTLLADGDIIPASAYGNRVITLHLDGNHMDADTAATRMQQLARELDRPTNILRFRAGTTQPVFFLTFRSDMTGVEWDGVNRRATVTILAQGAGVGPKVSIAPITVNNDPAAASYPMYFDMTGVLGDIETPLFLSVQATDVSGDSKTSVIAVRRRGTPSATPFLLQAESMTMGTNTTVQANSASMSGAGSNYVRCTFGTPAMTSRLTAAHPSSASPDVRGTYRVFLRYRKSVAGDVVKVRLRAFHSGLSIAGDTFTLVADATLHWQDLGLWQIPLGGAPAEDGYSGTAHNVAGMSLSVDAERTSGSGNLDMDALIFVPADDRLAMIRWPGLGNTDQHILDPAISQIYGLDTTGAVAMDPPAKLAGGLPFISPNVTNRIFFIQDVGIELSTDSVTETTEITPYYWPKYTYVRPATT